MGTMVQHFEVLGPPLTPEVIRSASMTDLESLDDPSGADPAREKVLRWNEERR